jgi:hypothetical protein
METDMRTTTATLAALVILMAVSGTGRPGPARQIHDG